MMRRTPCSVNDSAHLVGIQPACRAVDRRARLGTRDRQQWVAGKRQSLQTEMHSNTTQNVRDM